MLIANATDQILTGIKGVRIICDLIVIGWCTGARCGLHLTVMFKENYVEARIQSKSFAVKEKLHK